MTALLDGVYVGLEPGAYFAQPRLGSTDLAKLHNDPAGWWYGSPHNPDRQERERTAELDFGTALHAYVLEGPAAYDALTAISPFEDFRTKEARTWRDEVAAQGRIILTDDMDRRVRHMGELILNHPELGAALKAGLSEVSVLFEIDGLPVRARFDKLLPRFVVDLKSFRAGTRGRNVVERCLNLVAERQMDVQRYLYDRARAAMVDLVREDRIYGATEDQAEWLRRVADEPEWSWVWIFFQRRDDRAGHAPIVQPIERGPLDCTFDTGRQKVATAIANYRDYVGRFGLETPWAVISPMIRPVDHAFPHWLSEVSEPEAGLLEHEQKDAAE